MEFASLGEPSGDPASFAISWATLFERAALPGAGIVSVADRSDATIEAKQPVGLSASGTAEPGEQQDREKHLSPIFAVLAAALLFGATRRT